VRQDENTAVQSRSFGAVADEYNRLRPGPSDEALAWLIPEGAFDVLEIGAGTGILTRLLAERVAHVTADGGVSALGHEQCAPVIAPLTAPIQMGAPEGLPKVRKFSWAEKY